MHKWLRNPETGGVWACPDPVVDIYVKRGWESCDEPQTDESHLHDPKPPAKPDKEPTRKAAPRGQSTAKEQ